MKKRAGFNTFFILFAIEGLLLQFTGSINGFANNLFATNLGATDSQIGLVQTVPNVVAIVFLLPLGILSDKLKSSKIVPMMTLITMSLGYILLTFVPTISKNNMMFFYCGIALTVGSTAIYNSQWQNFFGNTVHQKDQTQILTIRNKAMFIVGIIAPVLCGFFMSRHELSSGKLMVLQIFFGLCAVACIFQFISVIFIKESEELSARDRERKISVLESLKISFSDRKFLLCFVPLVFFYMTWQIDWGMWYIGQVDYLGFTEVNLSIYNGIFNIGQLVAIGYVSKIVFKKGPDYAIILAPIALASCPAIMILASTFPASIRVPAFTGLVTVFALTQCAVNLCVVQMLLAATIKECRNVAIAIYTITTTLTNSFMPFIGVKIYEAFGSDYKAFVIFNLITFVLRLIAILIFVIRYKLFYASRDSKL